MRSYTNSIFFQCERLSGGMQKIAEASEQLEDLNQKLAIQNIAVKEKSASCEEMLEDISTKTEIATEKKDLAQTKGKEIEEQSKIIVVEKVRVLC